MCPLYRWIHRWWAAQAVEGSLLLSVDAGQTPAAGMSHCCVVRFNMTLLVLIMSLTRDRLKIHQINKRQREKHRHVRHIQVHETTHISRPSDVCWLRNTFIFYTCSGLISCVYLDTCVIYLMDTVSILNAGYKERLVEMYRLMQVCECRTQSL